MKMTGKFAGWLILLLAISTLGMGLAVEKWGSAAPAGKLRIDFLDVGQGDSILVRTPQGKVMLVDGGTPQGSAGLVKILQALGVRRIDVLVGTHPHADHIGGLPEVLNHFPVGKVYDSGTVHTTALYEGYLKLIDRKGIPFYLARRGGEIPLDSSVKVQILWPEEKTAQRSQDMNEASVVLRVTYGGVGVLLTGDIGFESEKALVKGGLGRTQVLKVGHHGSKWSTGKELLSRTRPAAAVIEVGRGNPYGHPAPEALGRLKAAGVQVWRTDIHGRVTLVTDGSTWRVEAERGGAGEDGQGRHFAAAGGH